LAHKTADIAVLQVDERLFSLLKVRREGNEVRILESVQDHGEFGGEPGDLEESLKAFAEKHAFADHQVYSILPRFDITTRVLTLPSQDDSEIASMLELSAEEYVPFSPDELVIKHAIIRNLPSGESSVLVAFARKDLIDTHLTLMRDAGIDPERVLFSTTCLASATSAVSPQTEDPYAVADLSAGGMEVIVMQGPHLVYARGVASRHDWSLTGEAANDMLEELGIELRGSLGTYRRESADGRPVEHMYLTSDWARPQEAVEVLLHQTGKDAALASFADRLVQDADKLEYPSLTLIGGALTAIGKAPLVIDLTPQDVLQERKIAGVWQKSIRYLIAAGIILVLIGVAYGQAAYQRQKLISEYEQQVRILAPSAEGVSEKMSQLQILRRQVEKSGSVLEILAGAVEALPNDKINITRFTYDREYGSNLWGRALTLDDVANYSNSLRAIGTSGLEMLSRAHRMYEDKASERGKSVIEYQIGIPTEDEEESDDDSAL
jgi:type II secretory pathway component PulL